MIFETALKTLVFTSLFVSTVSLASAAPTKNEPVAKETKAERAKRETSEAASAVSDYAAESKEEFQRDTERRLAQLKVRMDELEAQSATASAEMKKQISEQMAKLSQRRVELEKKLAVAAEKSGRVWSKMRPGLERAMSELMTAFQEAKKEFQNEQSKQAAKVEPTPVPKTKKSGASSTNSDWQ